MTLFTRLSCTALLFLFVASPAGLFAQSKSQAPQLPPLKKITSVEQLMPYARYYVKTPYRGMVSLMKPSLGAKAGDKILLICEITGVRALVE